jgi:hypothetical protein
MGQAARSFSTSCGGGHRSRSSLSTCSRLTAGHSEAAAPGAEATTSRDRAEAVGDDHLHNGHRRTRPRPLRGGLRRRPRGYRRQARGERLRRGGSDLTVGEDQEPGVQPSDRSARAVRAGVQPEQVRRNGLMAEGPHDKAEDRIGKWSSFANLRVADRARSSSSEARHRRGETRS